MLLHPRDRRDIPIWENVSSTDWADWRWQLKNRIDSLETLRQVVNLSEEEEASLKASDGLFRFAVTPHYATHIDPDDPSCPIRRQAIPTGGEFAVADFEMEDPLHEDSLSPVPGLTHRYPDRVLLLITHECSLYCRYCTRRRIVGDQQPMSTAMLDRAIDYVRQTPAVRDVLLSGGDPLSVPDKRLEYAISQLRAIPHVEIIRLGTRMPVVMPQRITPELVNMLKRYHPVWLNTHFNHPLELASEATRIAMERLVDNGIPTGNQSVLLKGINDCPVLMRQLVKTLVQLRCRPYYLYNCDLSEGLSHFRTPVSTGLAIIEALRGHVSGYAVPTFVIDAPGGGGKIPLQPDYVLAHGDGTITLRNYEGIETVYTEGEPAAPSVDGLCPLCGTAHEEIDKGPAADLWRLDRAPAVLNSNGRRHPALVA
jgi:lysine 2,3-aminomutase